MPAHEHLNNYLFAEQFQHMHGMTVDQALSGKIAKINSTLVTPEEYDEFNKGFTSKRERVPFAEMHAKNMESGDIPDFLKRYQGNWNTHLTGSPYQIAATLRDLSNVARQQSMPNPVPLYRGAGLSPSLDIGPQKTRPLSFTDDRYVAKSFASLDKMNSKQIYKAKPNMVRSVKLSDIGGIKRTVGSGRRDESEYFVLPESIPQEWPKK